MGESIFRGIVAGPFTWFMRKKQGRRRERTSGAIERRKATAVRREITRAYFRAHKPVLTLFRGGGRKEGGG